MRPYINRFIVPHEEGPHDTKKSIVLHSISSFKVLVIFVHFWDLVPGGYPAMVHLFVTKHFFCEIINLITFGACFLSAFFNVKDAVVLLGLYKNLVIYLCFILILIDKFESVELNLLQLV